MDTLKKSKREELMAVEAAEWVDRLKRADATDDDAFLAYLRESPRHVQELLLAHGWDNELAQLLDPDREIDIDTLIAAAGNIHPIDLTAPRRSGGAADTIGTVAVAPSESADQAAGWHELPVLPYEAKGEPQKKRWWMTTKRVSSIAALLGIFSLLALWAVSWMQAGTFHASDFQTNVGEQRSVELADGSVIALNTESAVQVKFSQNSRDVVLNRGQALFSVAKDPSRPFRVHAAGAIVQAIGTKFDVRRNRDQIKVAVIEGRVQVSARSAPTVGLSRLAEMADPAKVGAGQAITIDVNGTITPPAPIDPVEVSAWQQRRLVFRNNTLAEIADEFARYNRSPQIRVEGDELRGQRIPVAVFDADDPESLIVFLASDESLVFDHHGDQLIIRRRPVVVNSSN